MLGPIEVLAIGFKGNQFRGEILPALREVVERGVIRIIDLVFIKKERSGDIRVQEIKDLNPEMARDINPLISDVLGLISENDIQKLASEMENNSSAGIMVFEHLWAKKFKEAVIRANGKLILEARIPDQVAVEAEAACEIPVKT
jgi:hypothetical protein